MSRHYIATTEDRAELAKELKALEGRPLTPELAQRLGVDSASVVKAVGSDPRGAFVELEPMGFFTTSKGAA